MYFLYVVVKSFDVFAQLVSLILRERAQLAQSTRQSANLGVQLATRRVGKHGLTVITANCISSVRVKDAYVRGD
jgi:hypothetical protein